MHGAPRRGVGEHGGRHSTGSVNLMTAGFELCVRALDVRGQPTKIMAHGGFLVDEMATDLGLMCTSLTSRARLCNGRSTREAEGSSRGDVVGRQQSAPSDSCAADEAQCYNRRCECCRGLTSRRLKMIAVPPKWNGSLFCFLA